MICIIFSITSYILLGDLLRKAKLFIINVVILTSTSILMQTIGLSFNVYISNKVGSESIGIFQLIMSVYTFFITLATSGINLATTRVVAEEIACNNKNGSLKAAKQAIFYSFCVGTLACLILLFAANFIVHICLHDKVTKTPIYIIALSLPFISMSAAINGYFSAIRKVFKTASSQILEQFVKIIITSTLLSIFLPKGLEYACICLVIGTCVSEALSFLYVYLLYHLDKRKQNKSNESKKSYKKEILNICIPIAITSYIRSGLSTFKQLMIPLRLEKSGLSCEQSLSQYGLISGMTLPILLFPSVFINSFSTLLIPEFSTIFVKKNYKRIYTLTSKIFKSTLLFSACIFGIFLNFSDELSQIIYQNTQVGTYLLYLAPIVLIMYLDTVVDGMLKGLNEQVNVMKCNILDLFVSISFIYFLLPIYSIYGYLAVIYISEILNGIISIHQLKKVTKIKIKFFSWIIMPIGCALLSRYFINIFAITLPSPISTLFCNILLYCLIYFLLLCFSNCVTKKDFKL